MRVFANIVGLCLFYASPAVAQQGTPRLSFNIARLSYPLEARQILGPRRAGFLCLPAGKVRWRDMALPAVADVEHAVDQAGWARSLGLTLQQSHPVFLLAPADLVVAGTLVNAQISMCVPGRNIGIGRRVVTGGGQITLRWDIWQTSSKSLISQKQVVVPIAFADMDPRRSHAALAAAIAQSLEFALQSRQ